MLRINEFAKLLYDTSSGCSQGEAVPSGLSVAAWLTALSLRAGLPGDAWRWMNLDAWQRATGRALWH